MPIDLIGNGAASSVRLNNAGMIIKNASSTTIGTISPSGITFNGASICLSGSGNLDLLGAGAASSIRLNNSGIVIKNSSNATIGTISPTGITFTNSTITGGTIQTATSGERIVINSASSLSQITFETGLAGQLTPGYLAIDTYGTSQGFVRLMSPNFGTGAGYGTASISMWSSTSGETASIRLDVEGAISMFDTGRTYLYGNLQIDDIFQICFVGGDPMTNRCSIKWNGTGLDVGRNADDTGFITTKVGILDVMGTHLSLFDGTNYAQLSFDHSTGTLKYAHGGVTKTITAT
jgi:hypothetical protein